MIPVTRRFDWSVLVAAVCVACSWFALTSLITDLGFLQIRFRFYDVLTLMQAPRIILTGPTGDSARVNAVIFGIVCAVALLASLAPLVASRRVAWLGCLAPMVLMAIVGAVLYHELSQEMFADSGSYGDTGSQIIRFANSLVDKVGAAVTRQVHVGAGGYLGLLASAILAVRGLLGFSRAP